MSVRVFKDMLGQVMTSVTNHDDEMLAFETASGNTHKFYHIQNCCENVSIEDICVDLSDLVGLPLLVAEEVDNIDEPQCSAASYTWTFYKFATAKGSITVRWLGTSNGCYGEGVGYFQERTGVSVLPSRPGRSGEVRS